MFTLRPTYLLTSIALLAVLAAIALWVRDGFVRPFLGDVLAVMWLYTALGSVIDVTAKRGILVAWAGAVALEVGQYVGLITILGLEGSKLARVVLGATFDPLDLLAYTIGAACVGAIEYVLARRREATTSDTST